MGGGPKGDRGGVQVGLGGVPGTSRGVLGGWGFLAIIPGSGRAPGEFLGGPSGAGGGGPGPGAAPAQGPAAAALALAHGDGAGAGAGQAGHGGGGHCGDTAAGLEPGPWPSNPGQLPLQITPPSQ